MDSEEELVPMQGNKPFGDVSVRHFLLDPRETRILSKFFEIEVSDKVQKERRVGYYFQQLALVCKDDWKQQDKNLVREWCKLQRMLKQKIFEIFNEKQDYSNSDIIGKCVEELGLQHHYLEAWEGEIDKIITMVFMLMQDSDDEHISKTMEELHQEKFEPCFSPGEDVRDAGVDGADAAEDREDAADEEEDGPDPDSEEASSIRMALMAVCDELGEEVLAETTPKVLQRTIEKRLKKEEGDLDEWKKLIIKWYELGGCIKVALRKFLQDLDEDAEVTPKAIRRELEQQLDLDEGDLDCWKTVIDTWIIKFNDELTALSPLPTPSPKPKPASRPDAPTEDAAIGDSAADKQKCEPQQVVAAEAESANEGTRAQDSEAVQLVQSTNGPGGVRVSEKKRSAQEDEGASEVNGEDPAVPSVIAAGAELSGAASSVEQRRNPGADAAEGGRDACEEKETTRKLVSSFLEEYVEKLLAGTDIKYREVRQALQEKFEKEWAFIHGFWKDMVDELLIKKRISMFLQEYLLQLPAGTDLSKIKKGTVRKALENNFKEEWQYMVATQESFWKNEAQMLITRKRISNCMEEYLEQHPDALNVATDVSWSIFKPALKTHFKERWTDVLKDEEQFLFQEGESNIVRMIEKQEMSKTAEKPPQGDDQPKRAEKSLQDILNDLLSAHESTDVKEQQVSLCMFLKSSAITMEFLAKPAGNFRSVGRFVKKLGKSEDKVVSEKANELVAKWKAFVESKCEKQPLKQQEIEAEKPPKPPKQPKQKEVKAVIEAVIEAEKPPKSPKQEEVKAVIEAETPPKPQKQPKQKEVKAVIEAEKPPKQKKIEIKMDEDGYFLYEQYRFTRRPVGDGNPDPELDNISDGHRLASRFKWRGACKIFSGNINNECMLEIALRFNLDPGDLIKMQQNKANSTKGFTPRAKLFACTMIILPSDAKDSGYFYRIQNHRKRLSKDGGGSNGDGGGQDDCESTRPPKQVFLFVLFYFF
jgi:hypothetical protein